MRSIAALCIVALAGAQGLVAQADTSAAPCSGPHGPPIATLQALAQQYHPEALAPAQSRAFVVVAFLLDSHCQVLHHAIGRRVGEKIDPDSTLAALFPEVQIKPWVVQGIADATAGHPLAEGQPWIVWAVKKS